jgi:flagellar protein FlaG
MEVNTNSELKGQMLTTAPAMERDLRQQAATRSVQRKDEAAAATLEQKMRQQQAEEISPELIARAVEAIQESIDSLSTTLNFTMDQRSDSIVIQVKRKDSDEVIRQIPAEELLKLRAHLENLRGILFDRQA